MKSSSSTSLAKPRSQSDLGSSVSGSPTRTRGAPNKKGRTKSRSRNTSLGSDPRMEGSANGDAHSGQDSDDLFDSGSDEDLSDEESDDLGDDDIPVTGFAVASNKRNADFHELFPTIPEGDYLIDDYGCALQREILIQGRLYISENHVCFHANIFGWITDLCIPMYEITSLEKKMTAFVIPNAIQINTRTAKYTFASFLSRDTTFDVIFNIWRLARPEDWSMGDRSARPSLEGAGQAGDAVVPAGAKGKIKAARKVTQCACLKNGDHYTETAMDTVLPGTPEKIYNLMFASGFVKEFMVQDQKLQDIQISDWTPIPDNPKCLARNMSYIKPLSGGLGPKQTKCELRDETMHCDFDDYVVMLTTTRTPDVPSGNVFSVKTKTCLMWASNVSTRIIVTSQVEWTGRSFIKGIIEKSCLEGQKTYHAELDAAIRRYISEHQSEFVPEGVDPAAAIAEAEDELVESSVSATPGQERTSTDSARKSRASSGNQRGLQWAWDTFEGAYKVGKQSAVGAIELIKDAWDQSSTTTILYFIIIFLVISNIYSLIIVGKREDVGRRKEMKRTEEREKWVQGVVTTLWEELAASRSGGAPTIRASDDWRGEVADINKALDVLELRVQNLRGSLKDLD
ncbi:GRAM-domain-containing protein [Gloeophyllum trabeum ATCC 11539]|uniref:GRAM-domain-containing protein n=1 Tax=Gloeophyllum trabeum (strain ATCC 11539 / FP-39264 / Madison 617) TaxID=670483 RepID=S7S317_GLOTA|nr:GRAM-domain-containing protein [Gloeophyllum trabeum ATCC 11539]EPQ60214.1 GRAM-domain-containing protein [Gloeophyllum trabeum ATCC 11539]